jgi:hypothetical protein
MTEAQKVAFNELWDALSSILEEPRCVIPDDLHQQSLWAIDRAQHVTAGMGFPDAKSNVGMAGPVGLAGNKGETSRRTDIQAKKT